LPKKSKKSTPFFHSKHNTSSHSDPPQADKPTCADGTAIRCGSHAFGVIKSARRQPLLKAFKKLKAFLPKPFVYKRRARGEKSKY
jgi:hypothetical protein